MTDEQLALTVATRDESAQHLLKARQAYDDLYLRHSRLLLAFLATRVSRSDLEDVSQEVWQRIWIAIPKQFKGGNFRAWLHQITRNHLIDRSRRKKTDSLNEEIQYSDPKAQRPEELLMDEERQTILQNCLQRLGDKLAALVRARLTGDDYEEICVRLDISPGQVYKLFHQAKSQLTTCVERSLP